jgi:hypothetical protein
MMAMMFVVFGDSTTPKKDNTMPPSIQPSRVI